MEFADSLDLEKRIKKQVKSAAQFSESEIWSIFAQLVKALHCLHSNKILHRDLKSANIFLNNTNEVKLGDLNVSKINKVGLVYTQTGTPYYASPEIWRDRPYDYKSDIWSLGVILYEMTCLHPPFMGPNMDSVYQKVIRGKFGSIPVIYSKDLANMIAAMLHINPNLRPSCEKLLKVLKNLNKTTSTFAETKNSFLLSTIKFPLNIVDINRVMPESKYEQNVQSLASSGIGANKVSAIKRNFGMPFKVSRFDDLFGGPKMNVRQDVSMQNEVKEVKVRSREQPRFKPSTPLKLLFKKTVG